MLVYSTTPGIHSMNTDRALLTVHQIIFYGYILKQRGTLCQPFFRRLYAEVAILLQGKDDDSLPGFRAYIGMQASYLASGNIGNQILKQ